MGAGGSSSGRSPSCGGRMSETAEAIRRLSPDAVVTIEVAPAFANASGAAWEASMLSWAATIGPGARGEHQMRLNRPSAGPLPDGGPGYSQGGRADWTFVSSARKLGPRRWGADDRTPTGSTPLPSESCAADPRSATFTIVNLILDRPAIPEFFQERCTGGRLAEPALRLLRDADARRTQREAAATALAALRPQGKSPSVRAAEVILDVVRRRSGARSEQGAFR